MLTMTVTPGAPSDADLDRPPLDYPAGRELADDRTLKDSAHAVYGHLAARCVFTRFVTVKAVTIERRLNMDDDTVRRALRALIEHGYIDVAPSGDSRARAFRLVWSRSITSEAPAA